MGVVDNLDVRGYSVVVLGLVNVEALQRGGGGFGCSSFAFVLPGPANRYSLPDHDAAPRI